VRFTPQRQDGEKRTCFAPLERRLVEKLVRDSMRLRKRHEHPAIVARREHVRRHLREPTRNVVTERFGANLRKLEPWIDVEHDGAAKSHFGFAGLELRQRKRGGFECQ
jgi:hypothetical protein